MSDVTIVDYGAGNLHSVARAFEKVGGKIRLATTAAELMAAERLVLPGVGAFAACMNALRVLGLDASVVEFARTGKPLLGICVGMQMLFEGSDEFGRTDGLSLLPGWVRAIPAMRDVGTARKVPHVGWSELLPVPTCSGRQLRLLTSFDALPSVYFLHSFVAHPEEVTDEIARAEYEEFTFAAIVQRGNVAGCQFHPEKSGPGGLAILSNFMEMH